MFSEAFLWFFKIKIVVVYDIAVFANLEFVELLAAI